jgi:hypothetical protein
LRSSPPSLSPSPEQGSPTSTPNAYSTTPHAIRHSRVHALAFETPLLASSCGLSLRRSLDDGRGPSSMPRTWSSPCRLLPQPTSSPPTSSTHLHGRTVRHDAERLRASSSVTDGALLPSTPTPRSRQRPPPPIPVPFAPRSPCAVRAAHPPLSIFLVVSLFSPHHSRPACRGHPEQGPRAHPGSAAPPRRHAPSNRLLRKHRDSTEILPASKQPYAAPYVHLRLVSVIFPLRRGAVGKPRAPHPESILYFVDSSSTALSHLRPSRIICHVLSFIP